MRVAFIIYAILVSAVLITTLVYYLVNRVKDEKVPDEEK